MESVVTGIDAITSAGTKVLEWLISSATTVFNFIIENPLALLYLVIGLAFVCLTFFKKAVRK